MARLIGQIYTGGLRPADWDAVLDALIARTGSRFVMVSTVDRRRRDYSTSRFYGVEEGRFLDGVADYAARRFQDDPTLRFALRRPDAGRVSLLRMAEGREIVPAEFDYRRWVGSQLGTAECLVHYTPPTDDLIIGVSLNRAVARGMHDAAERRTFALLFDHMANAMRMALRPVGIDGSDAVLHLDRLGVVRHVSDAARAILRRGESLVVNGGRLRTVVRTDQARLDALIRSALSVLEEGGVGGGMPLRRSDGAGRPLLLTVRPLPPEEPAMHLVGRRAAVTIVDPAAAVAADMRWRDLFGLTPAEIRLAEALLNEEGGLRAAVDRLPVTYATARSQLASIFEKTGVRTQGQLIRLLARVRA